MQNSSLIEILRTFSKEQIKEFQDFVSSPYFNKRSGVTKLFEQIKKNYPGFEGEKMLRDNIWSSVFPGKKFNYGVMKNLVYALTKLTEEYISHSYITKNDDKTDINVLKFLIDKKQLKLAEKYIDKATKKFEQTFDKNSEYFRNKFDVEKVRITLLFSQLSDKHKLKSVIEFEQSGLYLIESFLISILEHYVIITNINKIHKTGIKTPLLNELLDFIKSNKKFLNNFYIKVYYYILLLNKEQKKEHYYLLKEILTGLDENVSTSFKYLIWVNITNYISFRYHSGESGVIPEQFELCKLSLEKKIYSTEDEEYFFLVNFITYFNIALQLNEFEWIEHFIGEYSVKLDINVREDIKNYCYACICTRKKKYKEATDYISKIRKLHEPMVKCGLKVLMLINYFELGWFESALNVADSFKHLLDKDKNIQEVIKEKFRRFIKAYLILIEFNNKKDVNTMLKFKKYISDTKEINSIQWLTRKAKEMGIMIDDK